MDIVSGRETVIYIADDDSLFPALDLFPATDLYPVAEQLREIKNVVAGTLKLDEVICENIPQFGRLFSTKFECQVYLEDDISGKYIHVYQREGNLYHNVFAGTIDSCKLDKVGTDRRIVAYDDAYIKGQIDVASWWTDFWTGHETATLKQVRDSLLDSCGVAYEDVVLPNDNLTVTKTVDLSTATMSSILQMICELNCCFPHFSRTGMMEFIILNTEATAIDISDLYDWMNSDFEDYVTSDIQGIQFYDSGAELKQTYGQPINAYPVRKNIFLYEKNAATLNQVGQVMLSYLSDFHFTPSKVKMIVGDFDLQLGDYIHTGKGNFYIFENSYSGTQFLEHTLSARGEKVLYDSVRGFDYDEIVLNEKIARVRQTVDEFYIEYADFKEGTSANFRLTAEAIQTEVTRATGAEGTLSSRITQTADSITAEVTRATNAEGTLSSRITQTADAITSEVTRASNAEGSLSTRITQTANDITAEVSRATTAEGNLSSRITVNANGIATKVSKDSVISSINQSAEAITINASKVNLTGYVTLTNLSTAGQTTINGGNITTGTIDASQVSVIKLNASNITTGTLSADKIKGGTLALGTPAGYSEASAIIYSTNYNIYLNKNGILVGNQAVSSANVSITNNGITIKNSSYGDITLASGVSSGNASVKVGGSSYYTNMVEGKISIKNSSANNYALEVEQGKAKFSNAAEFSQNVSFSGASSSYTVSCSSAFSCSGAASFTGGISASGYNDITLTASSRTITLDGSVKLGSSSGNLGFFNNAGTSKQTVNKLASSATLANVITKVNDLLTALKNYNLISST